MSDVSLNSLEKTKIQERRRLKRFNFHFSIKYCDKSTQQTSQGQLKDISYTGASLALPVSHEVSVQQPALINIPFPHSTVNIPAKVVWVRDTLHAKEVGVSFTYLSDYDKDVIYNNIFKYFREEIVNKWWQA
jgi:c-di-GMP-binding flagellar brake protein YcgR